MNCFHCGKPTKVFNSRNADSPDSAAPRLIRRAREAVSWQTSEWVVRQRKCVGCSRETETIELPIDDLIEGWKPLGIESEVEFDTHSDDSIE